MKGIVFNLLERAVTDAYGEDTWDTLLDNAGVDGSYTAVGTYSHDQLHALVRAASVALAMPPQDVLRWFGRNAMPMLAQKYPAFFDAPTSAREFLLTLNEVIHPEVRKLFPGAYAPSFDFDTSDERLLVMSYDSHRGLCGFAEGLIEGAAAHYGEAAVVEQAFCTQRGDERCVFGIELKPL